MGIFYSFREMKIWQLRRIQNKVKVDFKVIIRYRTEERACHTNSIFVFKFGSNINHDNFTEL